MFIVIDFPAKFRQLRKDRNLTQVQLAERLHISKAMVSSYETGVRLPSYVLLIKIATYFNVSTDFLLGRNDMKTIDVTGISDKSVALISGLVDELKSKS